MTADAAVQEPAAPTAPAAADLAARWALVLPHRERLRRIAVRRLGSRDEAQDVVQEAMLRAVTFERLDADYVGQFLSTVTVRLCADVQRDRSRQLRVGVKDAIRTVPAGDPHDAFLDRAEARWLYGECLKLPARESAVMLARAQGMSVRETATTLGVGMKSAEAAFTKARHRMRRAAQSAGVTVLGVLRRIRYAGAPAAVAASVTAVTVGGVVGVLTHADPPASAPTRQASAHSPHAAQQAAPPKGTSTATATTRAVPPLPDVRRTAANVVRDAPPPSGGSTAPRIETAPVGDPQYVGTREGIRAEESREEETFEESLQRCIGEILTPDPQHPLCDPQHD